MLLAGGACIVVGLRGDRHPLPPPVSAGRVPSTSTTEPAPAAGPEVGRSTPVALGIPALGLTVSLSMLGLNPDGTVEVPTDVQQPGWYRFGPTPGQDGSAVILGHVDSYRGPGVFFELRTLRVGDPIDVRLTDGVVADFEVTAIATYSKNRFPAQLVYGPHGYSALQLVTCGGTFDPATGHYLSNIVVYSSLVSTTPSSAS